MHHSDSTPTTAHTLVASFSASGVTAAVAATIAKVTGGALHAICPERPYTQADLDWHDSHSRSSVEMADASSRPPLRDNTVDVADYEVVYLGYPIWWDEAPRAINTFLESHELQGKVLIPFATSGSSSIANSVAVLKRHYPELNWQPGKLLNHASEASIRQWLEN